MKNHQNAVNGHFLDEGCLDFIANYSRRGTAGSLLLHAGTHNRLPITTISGIAKPIEKAFL